MEENNNELLWGVIARLIDKIGDELDRLNWDPAINMIADAFDEASKEEDSTKIFFLWYQFFWRFYYRVKNFQKPVPFNTVSKTTRIESHDDEPFFQISNYDYKMYLWCKTKGCIDSVTNNYFLVKEKDLSPAERKRFEARLS